MEKKLKLNLALRGVLVFADFLVIMKESFRDLLGMIW